MHIRASWTGQVIKSKLTAVPQYKVTRTHRIQQQASGGFLTPWKPSTSSVEGTKSMVVTHYSILCPDRALLRLNSCGKSTRNTTTKANQSAKAYAMFPLVVSFTDF